MQHPTYSKYSINGRSYHHFKPVGSQTLPVQTPKVHKQIYATNLTQGIFDLGFCQTLPCQKPDLFNNLKKETKSLYITKGKRRLLSHPDTN